MKKYSSFLNNFFPKTGVSTIGLALICLLFMTGNVYAQSGTDEGAINEDRIISIAIEHSVSEHYMMPGETAHFTVIVTNTGNIALDNVEILNPTVPDCAREIDGLAVDEIYTYGCELTRVNATMASEITVIGSAADFPLVAASAEVQVDIIGIVLSIAKEPLQVDPRNGGTITMTYSCTNGGSSAAFGVQLMETVPDGMHFVPEASDAGWMCENGSVEAGTTCLYEINRIEAGDVATGMFPFVVANIAETEDSRIVSGTGVSVGSVAETNPSISLFLPLING